MAKNLPAGHCSQIGHSIDALTNSPVRQGKYLTCVDVFIFFANPDWRSDRSKIDI